MDDRAEIDKLVDSLEIRCGGDRTPARIREIRDAFEDVLSSSPQLFMQVAERIFGEDSGCRDYIQYLFRSVPKHLIGVSTEEYTNWYMNLCIDVIKYDLAMTEMIDPAILGNDDFVEMAIRKRIALGNIEDWEGEYDDHVVTFVKRVKAGINIRATNRSGLQGITHGTASVLPPGQVEDFLGIKPKRGGSKRKRMKRKRTKRRMRPRNL